LRSAAGNGFIYLFYVQFSGLRKAQRLRQGLYNASKGDLIAHFCDLTRAGTADMDDTFGVSRDNG
jgi:hypothetical protein